MYACKCLPPRRIAAAGKSSERAETLFGLLFERPRLQAVGIVAAGTVAAGTVAGHIARVERMSDENSGYAVAFDPA